MLCALARQPPIPSDAHPDETLFSSEQKTDTSSAREIDVFLRRWAPSSGSHPYLSGMACSSARLTKDESAYFGDGHGRVYASRSGDGGKPTVLHTHGAAILCLLEADLVASGRVGLVIGDASGKVSYFFDGQLLLEHRLPLAITALALHRSGDRPAVVAADASGVIVLLAVDATIWRVRLQDARLLRANAPFASDLVSVAVGGAPCLVAAAGGTALVTLGSYGEILVWHAPGCISALATFESESCESCEDVCEDRRLLIAVDGQLHTAAATTAAAAGACSPFCQIGVHATQLQAQPCCGELLVACCGHFNGVLLVSRRGILQHVSPLSGWPLAIRVHTAPDGPAWAPSPQSTQTGHVKTLHGTIQVTIATSDGCVVEQRVELASGIVSGVPT